MILKNRSTLFLQFQPSIAGLANLFEGASANYFINFEENLSHAHGNFEEKNRSLIFPLCIAVPAQ
jgi:hypothetical protein